MGRRHDGRAAADTALAAKPTAAGTRDHRGRCARLRAARLPRCDHPRHRRCARHPAGEPVLLFPVQGGALELVCLQGVAGYFEVAKAIASGPGAAADKLARLVKSHLAPLADRSDFVRVFLNERQHLPSESRRRVGKWSRGLERVFEDVLKEGVRRGEFRPDLDTRLAVLGILGMANAVANWYRKEEAAIERIGGEFARLVVDGVKKRPKLRSRIPGVRRSAR